MMIMNIRWPIPGGKRVEDSRAKDKHTKSIMIGMMGTMRMITMSIRLIETIQKGIMIMMMLIKSA